MSTTLFYSESVINSDFFELDQEESKHCKRVLRMKPGDKLTLTDGLGTFYEAEISNPDPKKCTLQIISRQEVEKSGQAKVHMVVAPTKNISRFEWFLEKATEIGVDEITPLICTNSERTVVKTDRLNKVVIAAMKQSKQAWKPVLHEPEKMEKFIRNQFSAQKFIPWVSDSPIALLSKAYSKKQDCVILIGPEGDFTPGELASAGEAGFVPVSLGPNRLRTETAAIVASHTIHLINQI